MKAQLINTFRMARAQAMIFGTNELLNAMDEWSDNDIRWLNTPNPNIEERIKSQMNGAYKDDGNLS
jgi:hypothetical protein